MKIPIIWSHKFIFKKWGCKTKKFFRHYHFLGSNWDIPCQLTPFSVFFCRPSPILLKFGMFVDLDEKMFHNEFQVFNSNSF